MDELDVPVPLCRRVLLVDDEQGNLDVLAAVLEDDWEVITAPGGPQALAILEERGQVDLIIADQRMPGMTGVELLGQVAHKHPATMRIVLTGYTDVEPMLAAANLGLVYRFLLKPFDPLEMRALVQDAMQVKACAAALLELVTALDRRRRRLEESTIRLAEAREQLLAEERLETLGKLVARVAKELRPQTASLSLLLGLIRQTAQDEHVLDAAEAAWAGLATLRELLQQVRDYTQAATGAPRFRPVPPKKLLAETMELFLMEELGHLCPVHVGEVAFHEAMHVDSARLQQALLALLRNAVCASEPDEAIVVAIRREETGEIALEVRDRGRGMSSAELTEACRPFSQGFGSTGLGLGLEVARLGAHTHGGRLYLGSSPGEGTTARIVLPERLARGGPDAD